MSEYTQLTKTIVGRSPQVIARDIQRYSKLGYHIMNGQVHSCTKFKSLLPFRLETEYTVFMQKIIKEEAPHGTVIVDEKEE